MDSSVGRHGTALATWGWYGLRLVPLLFLAIFFFYPLISILAYSLTSDGHIDLSGFVTLVTRNRYLDTLWFTCWQAVVSTTLTIALALPTAFVFTRFRFPGKSLLMSLATLPFVLPTVVVAAAFSALLGPDGLVNDWLRDLLNLSGTPLRLQGTVLIILIVHVFYNYAIALRIISSFWANQSLRIEEAARVLGCSGWRLWWDVRLRLLRPAIAAAAALVFIFTFTSFGVVLILGEQHFATLEVDIYLEYNVFLNTSVAAALSLVQIGVMVLMMAVYTRLQSQVVVDLTRVEAVARVPRTNRERLLVASNLTIMALLLFTPLLALVLRAVTDRTGAFTLRYFSLLTENPRGSILFVPPIEAIRNSLIYAGITTVLALFLGVLAAYLLSARHSGRYGRYFARLLDPLFMLPLATSAVTLGFGFVIALDEPPLNLRTSPALIPLAHTLVAMPFVVRSVLPALRSVADSLREVASVLGASPFRVWRYVEWPLISRGVVVGATFAFTISMGEFGASSFVARPDTPTMPVVIYRLVSQQGLSNYQQGLAMSVILMAVCAISFVLIERLRTAGMGEF
jgi:thiamine transport system permease protein